LIISKLISIPLAVAGLATAAYAVARYTRSTEKRQLKADLREWEGEGGNFAPAEADVTTPTPMAAPSKYPA